MGKGILGGEHPWWRACVGESIHGGEHPRVQTFLGGERPQSGRASFQKSLWTGGQLHSMFQACTGGGVVQVLALGSGAVAGVHVGEPYGAGKHGCLPDASGSRKLKGIYPWLPEDHICLHCLM